VIAENLKNKEKKKKLKIILKKRFDLKWQYVVFECLELTIKYLDARSKNFLQQTFLWVYRSLN